MSLKSKWDYPEFCILTPDIFFSNDRDFAKSLCHIKIQQQK